MLLRCVLNLWSKDNKIFQPFLLFAVNPQASHRSDRTWHLLPTASSSAVTPLFHLFTFQLPHPTVPLSPEEDDGAPPAAPRSTAAGRTPPRRWWCSKLPDLRPSPSRRSPEALVGILAAVPLPHRRLVSSPPPDLPSPAALLPGCSPPRRRLQTGSEGPLLSFSLVLFQI